MLYIYKSILENAENLAIKSSSIEEIFKTLRQLPIDDFGFFLRTMPNSNYPNLSLVLPKNISSEVQKMWNGSSDDTLYLQTASFVKVISYNYHLYKKKGLVNSKIMDFGVGWGRFFRMFYYWSDPKHLWGVDAWQRSLDLCLKNNLPGNFILSDPKPKSLNIKGIKFDLIVSFSVFTHLEPATASTCLETLRKYVADDGLLIITIRPIEFWKFIDNVRKTNNAAKLEEEYHINGFSYYPHLGSEGDNYGDSCFSLKFFETKDWSLVGIDRSINDLYQLVCILKPI